jgi:uncharacterized OB-fold protein
MTVIAAEEQAPDTVFRTHLAKGELWLQRCDACGQHVFFPRVLCPHCGGALSWRKAGGGGTVYSTTTVRQRPERGGDYNISIIELDEGARMMSRVEDAAPAEVRIGMKVRAVVEQREDGPVVLFRPDTGSTS